MSTPVHPTTSQTYMVLDHDERYANRCDRRVLATVAHWGENGRKQASCPPPPTYTNFTQAQLFKRSCATDCPQFDVPFAPLVQSIVFPVQVLGRFACHRNDGEPSEASTPSGRCSPRECGHPRDVFAADIKRCWSGGKPSVLDLGFDLSLVRTLLRPR